MEILGSFTHESLVITFKNFWHFPRTDFFFFFSFGTFLLNILNTTELMHNAQASSDAGFCPQSQELVSQRKFCLIFSRPVSLPQSSSARRCWEIQRGEYMWWCLIRSGVAESKRVGKKKTFLIQFLSSPCFLFSYYCPNVLQIHKWLKSINWSLIHFVALNSIQRKGTIEFLLSCDMRGTLGISPLMKEERAGIFQLGCKGHGF